MENEDQPRRLRTVVGERHLIAAFCGSDQPHAAHNYFSVTTQSHYWCPGAIGLADAASTTMHDPVDHPAHYTSHPSGIECIEITEHMGFTLGNALKYIWRADLKGDAIEDLRKAAWYVQREIDKRQLEAERRGATGDPS